MLENLSSNQKTISAVVVVAGIVGWIFAFVQIGEVDALNDELGSAQQELASASDGLASANAELASASAELASAADQIAQLQADLEAARSDHSLLQQQFEATKSLEELEPALEAGKAELSSLQSEIEGLQVELAPLRAEIKRQQSLLEGSTLQFKTNTRARVRAGPATDTDEVAVVPAGKTLQVFEIVEDGTWYKVGGIGYIFHELLEPVE